VLNRAFIHRWRGASFSLVLGVAFSVASNVALRQTAFAQFRAPSQPGSDHRASLRAIKEQFAMYPPAGAAPASLAPAARRRLSRSETVNFGMPYLGGIFLSENLIPASGTTSIIFRFENSEDTKCETYRCRRVPFRPFVSKVKVREKTLLALLEQSSKAAVYFKGFGWVNAS
jgi:hypothetical protein